MTNKEIIALFTERTTHSITLLDAAIADTNDRIKVMKIKLMDVMLNNPKQQDIQDAFYKLATAKLTLQEMQLVRKALPKMKKSA